MAVEVADRIEKQVLLNAPRARVWQALTQAEQFGSWFGVRFDGEVNFTPGARVKGMVTHPGYEHLAWEVEIESVEPETRLSWRWHPYPADEERDYTAEATTLVVFELTDRDGGTMLTVTESGFQDIPSDRIAEAYRQNEEGWEAQMVAIAGYLDGSA